MKKLKLFFACLLMAVLSIGQMWADDVLAYTIEFQPTTSSSTAKNTSNFVSDLVTSGASYISSCTATARTYPDVNQIKLGSSSGTGSFTLSLSESGQVKATKVVLSAKYYDSGKTIKLTANSTSETFTPTNAFADYEVTLDGESNLTTISVESVTASKGRMYVNAIKVYIAGGDTPPTPAKTLSSVAVSGTPTKTSYYAGDDFDPAGLVVTGTYSDESQSTITSGITWSYDPSQELALNQTSIGVIATVSEIASPKFNVTGLTVSEAPAAATYEKVTSTENITDGDYLIVYEDGNVALNGALTTLDAVGNTVAVTINDGVITGSVAIDAATVTISTTAKTIQTASGYYIGITSYGNGLSSSTSNAYEHQNISIDGGNAVIYFQQESWNSNKNGKMQLCYNSDSNQRRFRYFKEGTQKAIQLYKKVDGSTVKPSAELSYAEADQKKLAKLGEAFTAPTLVNPHTVAVTYASSNTDVAEVASNGAVTIKAVGVAEITASFAGNDDYKPGSASYTLGVTTHAGTEVDPYDVADAKVVIDAVGTKENAYVSGIVSSIYSTSLGEGGVISFYISADGATTGQQLEAYKCLSLNSEAFTALSDVETGATVVITGTLKKFNSTYELDQNCHLVSYEAPVAPKQSIANDQDHPYTVAQALVYAADGVTYDLDDYVYVRGVVYDVKSFNNGAMNIFIKDADAENSFELFKCAGINDGSATTPFEALTDVQAGDIVIGYGQLTVFNTVYEFKQGNYLVDLDRPDVPVTGIDLTESTASVEVGSTVTLHASVVPGNATDQGIVWSVTSGSDKASVDENGVVTGVAEGTAVIRAASHEDATINAECTVTVTAVDPTKHTVTFDATIDISDQETSITKSGITITASKFNNNEEGKYYYQCYASSAMTVSSTVGNITNIELTCTASGTAKYGPGNWDFTGYSYSGANGSWTGSAETVEFGNASQQVRMTLITVTYKEDNRAAAGLAWSTDAVELTVGDEFTAPTLSNPNNIAAGEITIASDNPSLATVAAGVVSLVENATGTATITATFEGNEDYKPAVVSYTITVNAAALTDYYEKVTETAGIVEGTYLIVYEDESVAFNGGLETLDAKNNTIAVIIASGNKIGVTSATEAATFYIDPTAGTIQAANGKYIGVTTNSNGLKQSDNADAYSHNFSIDGEENAVIAAAFEGSTMSLRFNKGASDKRFRYYNNSQQPIALYKLANETIKDNPNLTWSGDVEITVGGEFASPTLTHAAGITGTITYTSDKETVATVDENGVISLVAEATGTAHITASYAGDENFKSGEAVCTIKVNPANSIYVSPSLNVNFGSVAKDATVEDKVITVTLTGVPAASVALAGDGASAFTFTPDALTASGDITISASSATAGTFNATLTISDDAGVAASKVVNLSLTVTEPEIVDDLSGTWVLATAVPEVGEKFIVAGTYNSVTKTMGAQNANNRAAVESSLSEGVLTPGEGTKVFTLVNAGEGKYAIQASNGKYLSAAGTGTNNYLREVANYEAVNAQWTISISEGFASVVASSSNRNDLQYNKSNPGLFSCYATDGQTPIQFFVQQSDTPEPPTPVYTDIRTGLTVGHYYTICYPNAMSSIKGATLWSFIGKDAQYAYLVQETASTIEAGKPYIMYATESTVQAVLGDETNAPGANGAIHGTFSNLTQDQLNTYATVAGNDLYLVIGNELRRATGEGTGGNTLPAQRAFVVVGDIPAAPAQVPAHVRRMPMQKDQAQGFENIEASEKPMKLMIDGQMYILRGEKMYDATGRLVK